jgi:hypothetical protein
LIVLVERSASGFAPVAVIFAPFATLMLLKLKTAI